MLYSKSDSVIDAFFVLVFSTAVYPRTLNTVPRAIHKTLLSVHPRYNSKQHHQPQTPTLSGFMASKKEAGDINYWGKERLKAVDESHASPSITRTLFGPQRLEAKLCLITSGPLSSRSPWKALATLLK